MEYINNNKKLFGMKTQNDALYNNILSKDSEFASTFERITIDFVNWDENTIFEALKQENKLFKDISAKFVVKPEKIKTIDVSTKESDEPDDEDYQEPIKKFNTICNMEDIKRAFFNDDLETFELLFLNQQFKLYAVNYKYNSDNDGKLAYVAKNLVSGMVKNFDDYRKYFMNVFRCYQPNLDELKYEYKSYWIVNTTEPIKNIIGSLYDDFEFVEISSDNLQKNIIKESKDNENCLIEKYVH